MYKKPIEDHRKKSQKNNILSDKLKASKVEQEKIREKSRTDGADLAASILVHTWLSEARKKTSWVVITR